MKTLGEAPGSTWEWKWDSDYTWLFGGLRVERLEERNYSTLVSECLED